jgi:O-succinylbenzoate synthase
VKGPLALRWRPFHVCLPQPLVTARGVVVDRSGWLLQLEAADGRLGWGEAAPLEPAAAQASGSPPIAAAARPPGAEPRSTWGHAPRPWGTAQRACAAAIATLGPRAQWRELEEALPQLPAPLAFAIGAALAELQGLVGEAAGGWGTAPASAWLLPAGEAMVPALEAWLAPLEPMEEQGPGPTLKWKVATGDDRLERELLEQLLLRMPAGGRLRLDANGGWDRATAAGWAERLAGEPRLDWLEQPLAADDLEGLTALAAQLPVALDESLVNEPGLRERWTGWQVRRPALEGDPRPLLAALAAGRPRWMVSTAFETSVGRRLVDHAAALQWRGPTPTAPGLAPQWRPQGPLFDGDPASAWAALAEGER